MPVHLDRKTTRDVVKTSPMRFQIYIPTLRWRHYRISKHFVISWSCMIYWSWLIASLICSIVLGAIVDKKLSPSLRAGQYERMQRVDNDCYRSTLPTRALHLVGGSCLGALYLHSRGRYVLWLGGVISWARHERKSSGNPGQTRRTSFW